MAPARSLAVHHAVRVVRVELEVRVVGLRVACARGLVGIGTSFNHRAARAPRTSAAALSAAGVG